jgi:K+-transporting ATPase ATPase C chain
MSRYISTSLKLLLFSVIICCGIYPATLWLVSQVFFSFQVNGRTVAGPHDKPVGSWLIDQP